MTDKQETRLSMFISVRDFIAANETKLSTLPAFSTISEQFKTIVAGLLSNSEEQIAERTRFAIDKAQVKSALIKQAFDMCRKLVAYAQLTDNSTLKREVDFKQSELCYAADADLRSRCEIIWQQANLYQQELAPYNITVAVVESLQSQLTAFSEVIPKPKAARNDRKLVADTLKTLFEEGDVLLKDKLDILLEAVQYSDINLYNAYLNARALNNVIGSRKRAVRVKVTDDAGNTLRNVDAIIEGSPIAKKTSVKGSFHINQMPSGVYKFSFSKPGYHSAIAMVNVNDWETAKVDVVLERVFENVIM